MTTTTPPRESGMPSDDWLDAALRAEGATHRDEYVDDGGFTARVMSALPPPAGLPAWRKPALAVLWAVAGAGVALALPGLLNDVVREVLRILGAQPISLAEIATAVGGLAAASWAAAAYTLRQT